MVKKYYKVKLFFSIAFCILTIVSVFCVIFLLYYIIGIRIQIDLDNATCENINMILVSLTTGYIVSYITYILSAHIPNYSRELQNEKILREQYLSRYRTDLTECFSLLYHLYRDDLSTLNKIKEVNNFFMESNPRWFYNEHLIAEVEKTNGKSLIPLFEKLKETSNLVLSMSKIYNCKLTIPLANAINPQLHDLIKIMQCEISNNITNFYFITGSMDLIVENFTLCRDK